MLGEKIYKHNYDADRYVACVIWCKENGAYIEDKGNYYECVELPPAPILPIDNTPTIEQRINDIELALIELAGDM